MEKSTYFFIFQFLLRNAEIVPLIELYKFYTQIHKKPKISISYSEFSSGILWMYNIYILEICIVLQSKMCRTIHRLKSIM